MGGIAVIGGILTWMFVQRPAQGRRHRRRRHRRRTGPGSPPTRSRVQVLARAAPAGNSHRGPAGVQLVFITSLVLFAFQVVFLTDVRHYTTQEATIVTSVFFLGFTI